ncbi:Plasmodium vivax Vir protein, putative [Plasmodium vivax]|nr:Plasmodium vivax Vir protein, putative [Plasmodium vivax]
MSEYITDVAKWENYSFLNNVWNTYAEFDNTLDGDTNFKSYEGVCEPIVRNYGNEKSRHKDFCMKLVKNLGCYNLDTQYHNPNNDRCIILYNWIHNTKKNYKHSNEIITKCFNDYNYLMSLVPGKYICSYDSYNNVYEDPIKMNILDIFNNNMHNIIPILKGEYDADEFSPQKFVCECAKLYKEIEMEYCTKKSGMDSKRVQTCQMLNIFKTSYMEFFYKILDKKDNIPSLHDVEQEYTKKCLSNKLELTPDAPTYNDDISFTSLYDDMGEKKNNFPSETPLNGENPGSPISSTISTAVGTMAGASSVLALLYKFTPGRKWIHSGFGGRRARIGSNLYEEGASELLYNGPESEDFSSYNQRYDIGYSPV